MTTLTSRRETPPPRDRQPPDSREPRRRQAPGSTQTGVPAQVRMALAALTATVLASAALRPLFAGSGWWVPVLLVILVCSVTGIAVRMLTPFWPATALAQVAALTATITALFAREDAFALIVPTPTSLATMRDLLGEGGEAIRQSAPPITVTPGVLLPAVLGMALVAFVVDLIAVSMEQPAVAGLPLLAVYSVPAAVLPHGVHWMYFLIAATGYLLLVAADRGDRIRAWGRVLGPSGVRDDLGGVLSGGRRAAAAALALAVLIPVLTPGISERLLTSGDGEGEGSGRSQINVVNPILTLRRNLASRSNATVITYNTTVADPEPLRIATDDVFDGERWAPSTGQISRKQRVQDGLPTAPGLSDATPRTPERTSIVIGNLDATYLPLPYPTTSVDIDGNWLYEKTSLNVVGDGQGTQGVRYTADHLAVSPTPEQLDTAPAPPAAVLSAFTALPSLPPEVARIAADVAGEGGAFQQALRIQDYLRSSGGFVYSEQAAGTGPDDSGLDAVLAFLNTKRGYCVQFASTMAVLARTLGIPSRVAVGFLPGRSTGDGQYRIALRDAHAWPELYFETVGWVRFEPTPSARVATLPGYAATDRTQEAAPEATPSDAGTGPSAVPSQRADRELAPETPIAQAEGASWWRSLPWRWLSALAAVGLLGVLPGLAAVVRRRRRWALVNSPVELAAAGWDDLRERLGDLGVVWTRSWTPRAALHRLTADHDLAGEDRQALAALVNTVETVWYAPPGAGPAIRKEEAGAWVDRVVHTVGSGLSPRARRRALFWPRSGLEALMALPRRVLGWRPTIERAGFGPGGADRTGGSADPLDVEPRDVRQGPHTEELPKVVADRDSGRFG